MKKLLVFGAGGHCLSVIDSLDKNSYSEIAALDLPENVGKQILGIKVVGCDNDAEKFFELGYTEAFITLGTIGNTLRRRYLYQEIKRIGFHIPNIIDPSAIVSSVNTTMGEGIFIGKGAIVNAGVEIGNCCILNTKSSIDHGSHIGEFVNVAPGSTISGDVTIESDTHIGTGSTVIQGIHIGEHTMIGAGSVVVKDIPSDVVAFGCPCKIKRKND